MSDRGVVYDLGYTPHDGPRLGRSAAVSATIGDGVRRIFGMRRPFRRKILPWSLFGVALLPAIVFVGIVFLTSQVMPGDTMETPFANAASYFEIAGGTVLLFCALAAPELFIPDRIDGVLSVYSSRPLTVLDYLSARVAALATAFVGFLVVPQLVLYLGLAALEPGGFAGNLASNWVELLRVIATTVVYLLAYGAPAVLVALFAKRTAVATGMYLGLMFALSGVAAGFTESGTRWAALVALTDHPGAVRDAIFDRSSTTLMATNGFDWWVSLAIILGIATITAILGVRRYRSLM